MDKNEFERLLLEYRELKKKTHIVAEDLDHTKKVQPVHIDHEDLMRIQEIAGKLYSQAGERLKNHPVDYYEIEQDAR